jgi:hypothetical protein
MSWDNYDELQYDLHTSISMLRAHLRDGLCIGLHKSFENVESILVCDI